MKTETPYSLKNGAESSKEYYMEVSDFTDHVLSQAEFQIGPVIDDFKGYKSQLCSRDLMIFESLMIGVLWRAYINRAVELDPTSQKLLAYLSSRRNKDENLKASIDHTRGILATSVLIPEGPETEDVPELTVRNLEKLLKWLEATGEFYEELKHLKPWMDFLCSLDPQRSSSHLVSIFMFADWFECAAQEKLGKYTCDLEEFVAENREKHLQKEDIILFTRKQSEYHLNMFGAEVMSRDFRESYEKRPKKALLLPICMCSLPEGVCMASETRLGMKCANCSPNCRVNSLSKCGEKKGFEVYVVSHESSALSQSTQKDRDELGIVGVACIPNLISGGWKSESLGIPAQCVLLESCGCEHWIEHREPTDINKDQLFKLLDIDAEPVKECWPCSTCSIKHDPILRHLNHSKT